VAFTSLGEEKGTSSIGDGDPLEVFRRELRVRVRLRSSGLTRELLDSCTHDAFTYLARRLPWRRRDALRDIDRRDDHLQVEPVVERACKAGSVRPDPFFGAVASMRLLAEIATRARIDSPNKERLGRKARSHPHAGDADVSHLERLPKQVERGRPELDQLVEKEYAVVRKRDLTRSHGVTPTKEADGADRVMWRAKGPYLDEPAL
jgi:hypothetical protein